MLYDEERRGALFGARRRRLPAAPPARRGRAGPHPSQHIHHPRHGRAAARAGRPGPAQLRELGIKRAGVLTNPISFIFNPPPPQLRPKKREGQARANGPDGKSWPRSLRRPKSDPPPHIYPKQLHGDTSTRRRFDAEPYSFFSGREGERAALREILRRAAAGRVSDDDASGPGGDAGVIGRPGKRRAEHATLPAGAGGNRAKRARDW